MPYSWLRRCHWPYRIASCLSNSWASCLWYRGCGSGRRWLQATTRKHELKINADIESFDHNHGRKYIFTMRSVANNYQVPQVSSAT